MARKNSDRDAEILRLYREGLTMRAIGGLHGLSVVRVSQLVFRAWRDSLSPERRAQLRRHAAACRASGVAVEWGQMAREDVIPVADDDRSSTAPR
jgi:hypothetical protein